MRLGGREIRLHRIVERGRRGRQERGGTGLYAQLRLGGLPVGEEGVEQEGVALEVDGPPPGEHLQSSSDHPSWMCSSPDLRRAPLVDVPLRPPQFTLRPPQFTSSRPLDLGLGASLERTAPNTGSYEMEAR